MSAETVAANSSGLKHGVAAGKSVGIAGTLTGSGTLTIESSQDNGTTWDQVSGSTLGTAQSFTTSFANCLFTAPSNGDGVLVRATNVGTGSWAVRWYGA